MSGFCGFLGKTDGNVVKSMIKTLAKNGSPAPVFFSDGYIHLGFVPYVSDDSMLIGHNESFTVWAMIECACGDERFCAQTFIENYEREGISFVSKLSEKFSAILWDGVKKRLYLVRDRYGSKPLFYSKRKNGFAFSTEVKAILGCDGDKEEINFGAVYEYMSFQSVYSEETVFENVKPVLPGYIGIYCNHEYTENEYANLMFGLKSRDGYEVAADKIERMLTGTIQNSVVRDSGIFLSGGLDSSLVAALAKKGSIKYAFCLKPTTKEGSIHQKEEDVLYSAQLAKTLGMEHHVLEMKPEELLKDIDDIVGSFAQPFSGTMSTYFLAKKAADYTKHIVTGDGADELFGSYTHHRVVLPLQRFARMKECGESFIDRKELKPYDDMIPFLDELYGYGGKNETLWYYRLLQMGDEEKSIFLNKDRFGKYVECRKTLHRCVEWDKKLKSHGILNRSLERDFYHLLPGHTLYYQDTLARESGINMIMPFLDNELTDYVATLPQEYKIKDGIDKAVLREIGRKKLPMEIINRRKEPFSLPVTEWMKVELKEFITDVLSEEMIKRYGLLDADCVQYAMNEFYRCPNTKSFYGGMLWTMAMLQKWAMLYM